MYWFALIIACLAGAVCAVGVSTATDSKVKTGLAFVVFTTITFVSFIS